MILYFILLNVFLERCVCFSSAHEVFDKKPISVVETLHDFEDSVINSFPDAAAKGISAKILQKCIDKCRAADVNHCCGNRHSREAWYSTHNLLSCANGCEIAYYETTVGGCKDRCVEGNAAKCEYRHPSIAWRFQKCQHCQTSGCKSSDPEECATGCDHAATLKKFYKPVEEQEWTLLSEHCPKGLCKKYRKGIWVIMWDKKYGNIYRKDAKKMVKRLEQVRKLSTKKLNMGDPINVSLKIYFNVYIHHGKEDIFPEWGVGLGQNAYGFPFLVFGNGPHDDDTYLDHEGFHVMQNSATAPGFKQNDAWWYGEATAEWFKQFRTNQGFNAGAIEAIPHQTMWRDFNNGPSDEPNNWSTTVRQYGMGLLLYYTTEVVGVDRLKITKGYYSSTTLLPQEYLCSEDGVGLERFRHIFADWTAHNVNDFDYLPTDEVENSRQDVVQYGDPELYRPFALEENLADVVNVGLIRPQEVNRPRGWSYNVIKLGNVQAGSYTFTIKSEELGSENGETYFEAKLVVTGSTNSKFVTIDMIQGQTGTKTVNLTSNDKVVYLILVSVPPRFTGNEQHDYAFKIE